MPHFDNLIIGAGLSGISAAYYLKTQCPKRSFAILERRAGIGGTWDLFKYPGIRSDSDMHTLGFAFKPWTDEQSIADGDRIMSYLAETVDQYGLREKICFRRTLLSADYDEQRAVWVLIIHNQETGATEPWTCRFLNLCTGYYDFDEGHDPAFKGREQFQGQIIHPQFWPEDLDYDGKRVAVIGSGATAVTLVPAMAEHAGHVTMVQRSPSYVISVPGQDKIAIALRKWLPPKAAYNMVRWKNVLINLLFFQWARKNPGPARRFLLKKMKKDLSPECIEQHFTPSYNPWDQRLCAVPDSDMFTAINEGRASIVTDHIAAFTSNGLKLQSGGEIEADIIVTATGLKLNAFGNAALSINGKPLRSGELMTYKGMMFANVPNIAVTTGYTNSSWTLKADLVSQYIARLMSYMDERDLVECMPVLNDPAAEKEDVIDFTSGYVTRARDILPKQGKRPPWRLAQSYPRDIARMRFGRIDDEVMRFRRADELVQAEQAPPTPAAAE